MSDTTRADGFAEALEASWTEHHKAQKALLDRDRPRYEDLLRYVETLVPAINATTNAEYEAGVSDVTVDLQQGRTQISFNLKRTDTDETKFHGYPSFDVSLTDTACKVIHQEMDRLDVTSAKKAISDQLLRQFGPNRPGTVLPITDRFPLKG